MVMNMDLLSNGITKLKLHYIRIGKARPWKFQTRKCFLSVLVPLWHLKHEQLRQFI